jgi:tripartite-type tricarboxylate transporter receptor subunit TctC
MTLRSLVAATLVCLSCGVHAQSNYPNKPVRLVAGFAPGGITDVLARAVAARLTAALGEQFIVENRPGAGTVIACDFVAKAPADGYTLLFQDATTHAINATYYKNLPYDSVKDFTPVGLVALSPLVLAVHPSVPARSVKDFIALAKANPAALTYGTGGVGTTGHIAGEVMANMAGIRLLHVAYKGSGPAVQGVLGGEIASTFSTTAALIPLMKAGRLRALGVSTATRIPGLAVPTIAESGVPGYEVVLYSGVLGPANLPLPIIEKLNVALVRIVTAAEVKETYANLGVVPFSDSPQEFAAHMKSEIAKFAKVLKNAGGEYK